MRHRLLVPIAALAVAAVPTTAALAAPASIPPVDPPSVAQICAATGIDAVDAYLAALAESQLVGELAPLLDLTVPRPAGGLTVEADVSLEQLRDALDCGEDTPPTTTTTTPAPTTTNPPDDDNDDDDSDDDDDNECTARCTQVDVVPDDGVETGDGSTVILG